MKEKVTREQIRADVKKQYIKKIDELESEKRKLLSDNLALLRYIFDLEGEYSKLKHSEDKFKEVEELAKRLPNESASSIIHTVNVRAAMGVLINNEKTNPYNAKQLLNKISYTLSDIIKRGHV